MPEFDISLFALGAAGGALPDALRFVKGRQQGFPEWFRQIGYWVGLIVLVGLGGAAAWLGGAADWQAAVAMGFTAPEVLSRLFSSDKPQTHGDFVGFPLLKWWSK